jgi:hypothetical protein
MPIAIARHLAHLWQYVATSPAVATPAELALRKMTY